MYRCPTPTLCLRNNFDINDDILNELELLQEIYYMYITASLVSICF